MPKSFSEHLPIQQLTQKPRDKQVNTVSPAVIIISGLMALSSMNKYKESEEFKDNYKLEPRDQYQVKKSSKPVYTSPQAKALINPMAALFSLLKQIIKSPGNIEIAGGFGVMPYFNQLLIWIFTALELGFRTLGTQGIRSTKNLLSNENLSIATRGILAIPASFPWMAGQALLTAADVISATRQAVDSLFYLINIAWWLTLPDLLPNTNVPSFTTVSKNLFKALINSMIPLLGSVGIYSLGEKISPLIQTPAYELVEVIMAIYLSGMVALLDKTMRTIVAMGVESYEGPAAKKLELEIIISNHQRSLESKRTPSDSKRFSQVLDSTAVTLPLTVAIPLGLQDTFGENSSRSSLDELKPHELKFELSTPKQEEEEKLKLESPLYSATLNNNAPFFKSFGGPSSNRRKSQHFTFLDAVKESIEGEKSRAESPPLSGSPKSKTILIDQETPAETSITPKSGMK